MTSRAFTRRRSIADGLQAAFASLIGVYVLGVSSLGSTLIRAKLPFSDLLVDIVRFALSAVLVAVAVQGVLLMLGRWPVLRESRGRIQLSFWKSVSLRDVQDVSVVHKHVALHGRDGIAFVLHSGQVEVVSADGWVDPVETVRDAVKAAIPTGAARHAGGALVS